MNDDERYFIEHLVAILNDETALDIIEKYSNVLTFAVLTSLLPNDIAQGELVLTYLLYHEKGIALLKANLPVLFHLDLNTLFTEDNPAYTSLLGAILCSEICVVLLQSPNLFENMDLNIGSTQGRDAGSALPHENLNY